MKIPQSFFDLIILYILEAFTFNLYYLYSTTTEKKRIAYCKDEDRKGDYPITEFEFIGYMYKAMYIKCRDGKMRNNFICYVSKKSGKAFRDKIKALEIHKRTGSTIQIISEMLNPLIRGWMNYFGKFNPSAMKYTLEVIEGRIIKWVMSKYKDFRGRRMALPS